FADGLNIPMGIYPWKGGCVAYSIPNIWHFEDADGDGICDKRTVLYGPFDTSRDTHGMVNSFRRGWDGWVYACHGFNNDSRVKGRDGHEIHMQSGNVLRFQLDGSRITRNKPEYHGSTIKAIAQPDFLSTTDPWFRPVDLQIGPDGAMYIADFYNRIIGHYEVPLPHPGRDRTSGRIWRVIYKGSD